MGEEDSSEPATDNQEAAYCSICGARLPDPEFVLNYPNFVCDDCNSAAVNEEGDTPWHGWPPGEEPDPESGVIPMTPDHGENPVYINGIKCWRRYRFGGHIALRDTFGCATLGEFYDRHENDDGYIQVYNSPSPPDDCLGQDRLLVQKADQDDWTVHAWGILSADTGEILARNTIAEQAIGPFENFLDRVEAHAGGEEYYEQAITDPTWMLSVFYSFGAQAQKPKVQFLVPELDRPISGLDGIVETGVLRGLREHDVSTDLFELGFRSTDRVSAYSGGSEEVSGQMTLTGATEDKKSDESNGSSLTIRYELPYRSSLKGVRDIGVDIVLSVLQGIGHAVEQTDYTYLTSLSAVDIHAYRGQREVLTIAFDAATVQDTDWESLSEHPLKVRDHAVAFTEKLSGAQ